MAKKKKGRSKKRSRAERYRSTAVIDEKPPPKKGRPSPAAVAEREYRDSVKAKPRRPKLRREATKAAPRKSEPTTQERRAPTTLQQRKTADEVKSYTNYGIMARYGKKERSQFLGEGRRYDPSKCKKRPMSKSGGGNGRPFVPWCVRK